MTAWYKSIKIYLKETPSQRYDSLILVCQGFFKGDPKPKVQSGLKVYKMCKYFYLGALCE